MTRPRYVTDCRFKCRLSLLPTNPIGPQSSRGLDCAEHSAAFKEKWDKLEAIIGPGQQHDAEAGTSVHRDGASGISCQR